MPRGNQGGRSQGEERVDKDTDKEKDQRIKERRKEFAEKMTLSFSSLSLALDCKVLYYCDIQVKLLYFFHYHSLLPTYKRVCLSDFSFSFFS